MERVEYHTPEEKKVCDWIVSIRRRNRKYLKCKNIQFPILDYNGKNISVGLIITYNKSTQSVSFGHYLAYNRYSFYPTKSQKLRCINTHAKEQYNKQIQAVKRNLKGRKICFNNCIENNIYVLEDLYYSQDGNVHFYSNFVSSHRTKLKYIDEK